MKKEYDVDRKCPKCGGSASTTYNTITGYYEECGQLKRTCLRCGYVWYEKPLDLKEK